MDNPEAHAAALVAEVQAAVRAANISQRELSIRTNIPLVTLGRRLSGQGKGFTISEVMAVADVLGISLVEISLRAERALARAAA